MKRTACLAALVAVLAVVFAAPTHSQMRRPSTRRDGPDSQFQSTPVPVPVPGQFDGTPAEQHAQRMREFQERMAQMQRQAEEMQRWAEENRNNAIRQALRVTDEQWRQIKPKLDLIERLKAEADVSLDLGSAGGAGNFQGGGTAFGGGFMGGWASGSGTTGSAGQPQTWSQYKSWGFPSNQRNSAEMTDGEALCEQLKRDLENPGTAPLEIDQRIAALRRIRAQARQQLAQARTDLRGFISRQQEAPLVLMGYLD